MSTSVDLQLNDESRRLLFTRPEYKTMIKTIGSKAVLLSDKNLVDSFYALAKIHRTDEREINLPKLIQPLLAEIEARCKQFNQHHLAYICNAFRYLRWTENTQEKQIYNQIIKRVDEILPEISLKRLSSILEYTEIHNHTNIKGKDFSKSNFYRHQ